MGCHPRSASCCVTLSRVPAMVVPLAVEMVVQHRCVLSAWALVVKAGQLLQLGQVKLQAVLA